MASSWPRYTFLMLFVSIALLGMFALYQINLAVFQPLNLQEKSHSLLVGQGKTLTSVVHDLADKGVVSYPHWLLLYARLHDQTSIRAGEYDIEQGMNGQALLQRLASGKVIQYQVTLIEGRTLADNLQTLYAQPKLINDLESMSPEAFEKQFGFPPDQAEGWFFPDTYSYVSGMKMSDVLKQAHNRMKMVLDEEWQKRAAGLPYRNPHEALVMASIIEKETGVAYERDEIAGVFVRRLAKGMKLQTDPTVIYGMGKAFDGDLKRSHLREYTPWNTYVIDGLPPTPIALPGRAAIHAALNPAPGKSLFFVARGDGTHVFSETLAQHEAAVRAFQLRRGKDYRSSPPPSAQQQSAKPPAAESASLSEQTVVQ